MEDRKIAEDSLQEAEGYLLALFTVLIKAHKARGKTGNISAFIKERLGDRTVASRVNVLLNELMNSIPKRTRLQREHAEKAGVKHNASSSSPVAHHSGSVNPAGGETGKTDDPNNLAKVAETQPELAPRLFSLADARVLDQIHKTGSINTAVSVPRGSPSPELPKGRYRITESDKARFRGLKTSDVANLPERDVVLILKHLEDRKVFEKPVPYQLRVNIIHRYVALLATKHADEV